MHPPRRLTPNATVSSKVTRAAAASLATAVPDGGVKWLGPLGSFDAFGTAGLERHRSGGEILDNQQSGWELHRAPLIAVPLAVRSFGRRPSHTCSRTAIATESWRARMAPRSRPARHGGRGRGPEEVGSLTDHRGIPDDEDPTELQRPDNRNCSTTSWPSPA
jgi:hypothetical protein